MNSFPSWIHQIPAMIEALALSETDPVDRRALQRILGLRRTTAFQFLRRFGAIQRGGGLVISRALLMARLREALEHPDWRWEHDRRNAVHSRIEALRPTRSRKSLVPIDEALDHQMSGAVSDLPASIRLESGQAIIGCRDAEDLLRQLVLLVHAADLDFDALDARVLARRPPTRATLIEPAETA